MSKSSNCYARQANSLTFSPIIIIDDQSKQRARPFEFLRKIFVFATARTGPLFSSAGPLFSTTGPLFSTIGPL